MVNLKESMNLAGQNLIHMLSPDNNYLPNFWIFVDSDYRAELRFVAPGHNIGRWWDAMLRLEDATGFKIPPDIEAAMRQNLRKFYDNADHLCLRPLDMPHVDGELLDFHSPRESLLALTGLIKYRNDQWAIKKAHLMLESIDRILFPYESWEANPGRGIWNVEKTHRYNEAGRPAIQSSWALSTIVSHGRLIEALIEYYKVSTDALALNLADKFARYHLADTTRPDGRYHARWDATEDPYIMRGHTHSYLNTLRGLLRYGELTGQHRYIDAVANTYRETVPKIVKKSGYTCHDLGDDSAHKGEVTSPGDAAQIALWLAVRHGYTEFLDDVEHIVRARLIPSQITDSPPLKLCNTDGAPVEARERIIGAIGGLHSTPHAGKQSVTDVTAAALHSLIDIYHHIAVANNRGLTIFFHLDYEDENLKITSMRSHQAKVDINLKNQENTFIRIPRWTPKETIRLTLNEEEFAPNIIGDFIVIPKDKLPGQIELSYDLPVNQEVEITDNVEYTLTWQGDEVIGITPNDDFFPFYPTGEKASIRGETLPTPKPIQFQAQPFDLQNVRLLDGPFKDSMLRDRNYLHALDADRLLHMFRITAGLPSSADPLGGWESPDFILRGAFIGHYLTACALMYVSADDEVLKNKSNYIVTELAKCQQAVGGGYLSAFPEDFLDDIEAGEPGRTGISRVSWYVIHKIMDGLFNVYKLIGSQQALDVLKNMAAWAKWRIYRLAEGHWQEVLNIEHGGMKGLLLNLYSVTQDPDHLRMAMRFEHKRIFDPLAERQDDILIWLHGNSTIPKILGAAHRYELLGEKRYHDIAEFFWDQIVNTRSYVTGGSTDHEHWQHQNKLSCQLSNRTHESCTTYNMLKLTRHLFGWTADPRYADYYERALFNGILPTQNPDDGMMMWYVPMASGYYKCFSMPESDDSPDRKDAFMCCVGTGIESFAKLSDSIYFHNGKELFINQFIASELWWQDKGLRLRQETDFPAEDYTQIILSLEKPIEFSFHLRIPYWATHGGEVLLNGKSLQVFSSHGDYLTVNRIWEDGDTLKLRLPMCLYLHPMPDDETLAAIMYGPLVLAGELGKEGVPSVKAGQASITEPVDAPAFVVESDDLHRWIQPVEGTPLTFRTVGQDEDVTLIPFYQLFGDRYAIYWRVYQMGSKAHADYLAEKYQRKDKLARTVDTIKVISNIESEHLHKIHSERSNASQHMGRNWRNAAEDGWFSYELAVLPDVPMTLSATYWGSETGYIFDIYVEDRCIATQTLNNNHPGEFVDVIYDIPIELTRDKDYVRVKFQGSVGMVFDCTILKGN